MLIGAGRCGYRWCGGYHSGGFVTPVYTNRYGGTFCYHRAWHIAGICADVRFESGDNRKTERMRINVED